jgi:hypothetical protein
MTHADLIIEVVVDMIEVIETTGIIVIIEVDITMITEDLTTDMEMIATIEMTIRFKDVDQMHLIIKEIAEVFTEDAEAFSVEAAFEEADMVEMMVHQDLKIFIDHLVSYDFIDLFFYLFK